VTARGLFIVIDGVDGCGKSTQAARLVAALRGARPAAPAHLREPGSTELGESLRELLLAGAVDPVPAAEALLFAAARRQMLEERVEPALAAGQDVVCERFNGSTFAYQAVAGGLDEKHVLELLRTWCGSPAPDVEFVLAIDPELARARRGADRDRIERKGAAFQDRVAAGLERYLNLEPRARRIDGTQAADAIAERILAEVAHARR